MLSKVVNMKDKTAKKADKSIDVDEVLDYITGAYSEEPTHENFEVALGMCVGVDESDLPPLVSLLVKHGDHNLTAGQITEKIRTTEDNMSTELTNEQKDKILDDLKEMNSITKEQAEANLDAETARIMDPIQDEVNESPALDFDGIKSYIAGDYAESIAEDKTDTADKTDYILEQACKLKRHEQRVIFKQLMEPKYKKVHNLTLGIMEEIVKGKIAESEIGGDPELPKVIANYLMQENDYITSKENKEIYIYKDGVYCIDDTRDVAKSVHDVLGVEVKPIHISNVESLIKDMTMQELPRNTDWINLKNGRFCLNEWKLLPHEPEHKSVIQVPVSYDPDAECPEFDKWLADVLPSGDERCLVMQLLGYSLLQDVRFNKIVALHGESDTGKGTLIKVVRRLVGEQNASSETWQALDKEDNRFSRSSLVGKLVNTSADLSDKHLAGDSQIKQISAGDAMQVEYKGTKSFTYEPFSTLWASCNNLPGSFDKSDAWLNRLILIPFEQEHGGDKMDTTVLDRMTTDAELSGILNQALLGLQVLLKENRFIETQSTMDLKREYKLDNNNVDRFLSECVELTSDKKNDRIPESEAYTKYTEWCEDEGIKATTKKRFLDGAERWGAKKVRGGSNGERVKSLACVKWL